MMKTHQFDGISFFTGLVFAAIGLLYLIPRDVSDIVDFFVDAGTWFWPALFLAVGAAVLIPALRPRGSDDSQGDQA
jgi:hypothetical protein